MTPKMEKSFAVLEELLGMIGQDYEDSSGFLLEAEGVVELLREQAEEREAWITRLSENAHLL